LKLIGPPSPQKHCVAMAQQTVVRGFDALQKAI
jgi:hypothetical protein